MSESNMHREGAIQLSTPTPDDDQDGVGSRSPSGRAKRGIHSLCKKGATVSGSIRERILSKTETAATTLFSLVAEDIDRYKKWNWHTGTESFNIWIRCLEDTDHVGQGRWHANAQWSLVRNRKAAVAYLREMQKRHTGTVNLHLANACKHYESVIAEMQKANTSNEAIKSKLGREALITIVKQVATLEGKAISELEIALSEMK
jgi:hypothetical protein